MAGESKERDTCRREILKVAVTCPGVTPYGNFSCFPGQGVVYLPQVCASRTLSPSDGVYSPFRAIRAPRNRRPVRRHDAAPFFRPKMAPFQGCDCCPERARLPVPRLPSRCFRRFLGSPGRVVQVTASSVSCFSQTNFSKQHQGISQRKKVVLKVITLLWCAMVNKYHVACCSSPLVAPAAASVG